ncbi:hypothetical protein PPYR_04618 [Photinus pyralis]|uniref:Zinc finger protein 865 n=2 Tax=Photinus pyralis TaxID=7054 RepID=A0A5N4AYJ1_PHOPY|nr:gastrula zinc finger protein XlCGF28.1-like [Photinus pyralis]KAB0802432.1 hypothetical protein PPYR_04618 [Photinus pyralis]
MCGYVPTKLVKIMETQISIDNLTNIKRVCRVCLTESKEMRKLNETFENMTIQEALQHTLSLKVILDEEYPSSICAVCSSLLKICYNFKLQFEASQGKLHKYFGKSETILESFQGAPSAQVELISKRGVYNLNDVFIVEDEDAHIPNYEGFLKNLGREITADFVPNTSLKLETAHRRCRNDAVCKDCNKSFSCSRYLKRHYKNMHLSKSDTFMCEVCGIITESKSKLHKHMHKQHSGRSKCEICQKCYFDANVLKLHMAAIHSKGRNLLCTICGKTFNYLSALTYHMRIHNDERNYKCTFCPRTFRMQCSLKRHLRTHTGIRPYQCSYCSKAFRSSGEVTCHEMIHTGFRPYHCKYCGKGFTKHFNLKVHLFNHKGPYVCELCDKSFIEQQFLKMHIEKIHLRLSKSNDMTD